MRQDDKNEQGLSDVAMKASELKIENEVDWRNEHGQPSFEYLQSLAEENSPSSLEKLRSIAEDLDVTYDRNVSPGVLIREILASSQSDPHSTS